MGICRHCGQKAGIFSSVHSECQSKYEKGVSDFTSVLRAYFFGGGAMSDILRAKTNLRSTAYLKDEDVCNISRNVVAEYVDKLRMPYTPDVVNKMDTFLNSIGVPFAQFNATGVVDGFSRKIVGGYMVDYFLDKVPLVQAKTNCARFLQLFPLNSSEVQNAYLSVLDKAARNFLKNGFLSPSEKVKIDDYVTELGLQVNNLPAQFQNSDIVKISQSMILDNLKRGIVPVVNAPLPILLTKGENLLWVYNGAELFMEKVEKEWVGRSHGVSVRIVRGVYYRVGQSKGKPIEHSHMQSQGKGQLIVTSKNLIFYSPQKTLKVPYTKLVGITPYSDGIEIHKDNSKRIAVQGLDPWFIMNYIQNYMNL
jgi:hypothetical protein